MSTNKRIPKRSIIGSRVAVEAEDGVWRLGRVLSMRPGQMFSVRLDATGQVRDHSEGRILGPGFLSSLPANTALRPGKSQLVYITHNGREVEGEVVDHDIEQDCVRVDIGDGSLITKRLEEIRLMESRKSARLVNTDTDFSLLADFNIVEQRRLAQTREAAGQMEAGGQSGGATPPLQSRRRLHSMSDFHDRKRQKNIDQERREAKRRQRSERQMTKSGLSTSIEVPGSGHGVSILGSGSRKRRTSESRAELDSGYGSSFGSGFFKTNEENVKECTAAMVLMNLSVSPRDKWFEPPADFYSDLSSPPPGTPRPSPAPSLSQIYLSEDEEPHKRPRPGQLVQYQCTWRGCGRVEVSQEAIEKHVRVHLGLPDPPPGTDYGGEEDFYYTEIEEELGTMELEQASDSGCSSASNDGMSCKPPLSPLASLTENKTGFVRILPSTIGSPASPSLASSVPANFGSCHPLGDHIGMARPSCEAPAPTTIYLVTPTKPASNNDQVYNSNSWQGKKLVSIVPRPETSPSSKSESESASPFVFKSNGSLAKSDKKCRKVYGIDQKDLWCTQCKWKKACGRFS